MLIGILGGPIGVLLGFTTGALLGSLVDVNKADQDQLVLSGISAALPVGQPALIVDAGENDEGILNSFFGTRDGQLSRWSYVEVEASAEAYEEADKALRKNWRRINARPIRKKDKPKGRLSRRNICLESELNRCF